MNTPRTFTDASNRPFIMLMQGVGFNLRGYMWWGFCQPCVCLGDFLIVYMISIWTGTCMCWNRVYWWTIPFLVAGNTSSYMIWCTKWVMECIDFHVATISPTRASVKVTRMGVAYIKWDKRRLCTNISVSSYERVIFFLRFPQQKTLRMYLN